MTKQEARRQLNIGYLLFILGIIIGYAFHLKQISPIGLGYLIWSTYWGYRLAYRPVKELIYHYLNRTPVTITANSIWDFWDKVHEFNLIMEFIMFFICYFVGALGGGIYMQIKLSRIAYF